jgi:hypothetical protein
MPDAGRFATSAIGVTYFNGPYPARTDDLLLVRTGLVPFYAENAVSLTPLTAKIGWKRLGKVSARG